MYHYVRPSPDRPPNGYYHLALDDFRRQLDYFAATDGFADQDAFAGFLHGKHPVPEGVVLTFDDALIDHYEWVLPELRQRDLWGLFFIPTGPFVNGRVLPVHRVHSLVGSVPAERLRRELEVVLNADPSVLEGADSVADAYGSQSSKEDISAFKRLLNFVVSPASVQSVLDRLEDRLSGYTPPTVSEYYLDADQLTDLSRAGMLLGAHSVTHPVLSRLEETEQRSEVASSIDWLEDRVDAQTIGAFAYPYGGSETFTEATIEVLVDLDRDVAFTTESGAVTDDDIQSTPFALPRRDCNEFEHGGATFDLP